MDSKLTRLYCRMMLTMKGKYGLKAMVHLANLPAQELAAGLDISEANDIPKKFLDAILAQLRGAGLIEAKKGKGGGYRLARAASKIMVGDIVRALDGPLAPILCASRTAYRRCTDCRDPRSCEVRIVMAEARDAIAAVLDRKSLADMSAARPSPRRKGR
jgi:Rrf2 family protein